MSYRRECNHKDTKANQGIHDSLAQPYKAPPAAARGNYWNRAVQKQQSWPMCMSCSRLELRNLTLVPTEFKIGAAWTAGIAESQGVGDSKDAVSSISINYSLQQPPLCAGSRQLFFVLFFMADKPQPSTALAAAHRSHPAWPSLDRRAQALLEHRRPAPRAAMGITGNVSQLPDKLPLI